MMRRDQFVTNLKLINQINNLKIIEISRLFLLIFSIQAKMLQCKMCITEFVVRLRH